jgi:hypothetical protein
MYSLESSTGENQKRNPAYLTLTHAPGDAYNRLVPHNLDGSHHKRLCLRWIQFARHNTAARLVVYMTTRKENP